MGTLKIDRHPNNGEGPGSILLDVRVTKLIFVQLTLRPRNLFLFLKCSSSSGQSSTGFFQNSPQASDCTLNL